MTGSDTPQPPALARAGIDRAGAERDEAGLIDRLCLDAAARVVVVHGERGLIAESGARLQLVRPADVRTAVEWAFLGRDASGAPVLLAVTGADADDPLLSPLPDGARWASLRAVGGDLEAVDAGLLVEAVSLGRWLVDAPFCSACGARTETRAAGWARHCPSCGREHFPRTDPAVIVAVQSADGTRLLLGKNAMWAERNMYSTFAGFVEAGESLEQAVVRETEEESGIAVHDLRYRGSQAWPYPRSLMLGFHAVAPEGAVARADGVEIVDARWFSRDELVAGLVCDADFGLPGPASIARRLIVDWVEAAP